MNMKKMLAKMQEIDKQELTESASMNISVNGDNSNEVANLMKIIQQAGLQPEVVDKSPISGPMRGDMDKFRAAVAGPTPMPPPCGADTTPDPVVMGIEDVTTNAGGGVNGPKAPEDIRVKDPSIADSIKNEDYSNEPDTEYSDMLTMIKDLAGGINREKRGYAKAQDGDNAMAVDETAVTVDQLEVGMDVMTTHGDTVNIDQIDPDGTIWGTVGGDQEVEVALDDITDIVGQPQESAPSDLELSIKERLLAALAAKQG